MHARSFSRDLEEIPEGELQQEGCLSDPECWFGDFLAGWVQVQISKEVHTFPVQGPFQSLLHVRCAAASRGKCKQARICGVKMKYQIRKSKQWYIKWKTVMRLIFLCLTPAFCKALQIQFYVTFPSAVVCVDWQGVWRRAVWPHCRKGLLHRDGCQSAHSASFGRSQLFALHGHSTQRSKGTAVFDIHSQTSFLLLLVLMSWLHF